MAFLATVAFNYAKEKITNMIRGMQYYASHEVVIGAKGDHADLLYLHEAGVPSKNIPPRPVLEPALSQGEVKGAMNRHMRKALRRALVGDLNGCKNEMERTGIVGENACKKYITDGTHLAPNSPVTIARKGSSIPLIDTGTMLNSITHEVRRK